MRLLLQYFQRIQYVHVCDEEKVSTLGRRRDSYHIIFILSAKNSNK